MSLRGKPIQCLSGVFAQIGFEPRKYGRNLLLRWLGPVETEGIRVVGWGLQCGDLAIQQRGRHEMTGTVGHSLGEDASWRVKPDEAGVSESGSQLFTVGGFQR